MKKLIFILLISFGVNGQTLTVSGTTYEITGNELLTIANSYFRGAQSTNQFNEQAVIDAIWHEVNYNVGQHFGRQLTLERTFISPTNEGDIQFWVDGKHFAIVLAKTNLGQEFIYLILEHGSDFRLEYPGWNAYGYAQVIREFLIRSAF